MSNEFTPQQQPYVEPPSGTATELATERRGLRCPKCACAHFEVVYTRPAAGNRIMRRRECRHCGRRITTYETSIG